MDKLPPIPTPLETQWREFRIQYLPVITFAVLVACLGTMWKSYVVPPNVLAQVEPISARVMSTTDGTLVELNVERYQKVTNGQVVAVVESMDTNAFQTALSVIEADLQIMNARLRQDDQRNVQNYIQELLAIISEKAQLEINRVNLKKAEADFLMSSNLFHNPPKSESEQAYNLAMYTYLSLCTNVLVTERSLAEKEKLLPALSGTNASHSITEAVERDVKAKIEQLRASQRLVLKSPIDGVVSAISNRVGEAVLRGRPIVVITAFQTSNILAYARQPLNIRPREGEWVQVRRQTFKREVGFAKVLQVGSQLEPIDRPLLGSGGTVRFGYDYGLPFLVGVPQHMNLSPGERVDVILNPRQKPESP